MEKKRREKEK